MQLQVKNETSRLRKVVLGIAESCGPTPNVEDCYDPKSVEHIKAGTYPEEKDMIFEMHAFAEVLKKYDVELYRPSQIQNYNQIFSRDVAFVIENKIIPFNL